MEMGAQRNALRFIKLRMNGTTKRDTDWGPAPILCSGSYVCAWQKCHNAALRVLLKKSL